MRKEMALLLLFILIITACNQVTNDGPKVYNKGKVYDSGETISFSSVSELKSFMNKYGKSDSAIRTFKSDVNMDFSVEPAANENSDYSETNNQVSGVDEADIIKTDGNYIYTVSGNKLFIIKAGEDAEILSAINLTDNPNGLFVYGNKLAVFGNIYSRRYNSRRMVYLKIYDISDRKNPKVEKDYKIDGYYFNARMVDDHVYLITKKGLNYDPIRPLPIIMDGDLVREVPLSNIRYFPIEYDSPVFININAVNLNDDKVNMLSLAVEGASNMYMSQDNIYLAYSKYINKYSIKKKISYEVFSDYITRKYLTDDDKKLIEKIKNIDDDILTENEKKMKIKQIIYSYEDYLSKDEEKKLDAEVEEKLKKELAKYEYRSYTYLRKIHVDGDNIDVAADGKVPGRIKNQFSMDEKDGILRIATTIEPDWETKKQSSNAVFALSPDLKIIGKLMDIAEGERIYSTRFMGDKLYMVTFRQVDPFFVIDLSNPKDIRYLGELKIPGFSRYLHPYDKTHIIGIGRDATETGRTQGLKISLFDVTDINNPVEVAKWEAKEKYSYSSAEYEHKAFLFSKEKHLLVIPAYSRNYRNQEEGYNGAMVFFINESEIKLRGIIDHSSAGWGPAVERSLYIGDLLYTKSRSLLRINRIDDLEAVKDIKLVSNDYKIY